MYTNINKYQNFLKNSKKFSKFKKKSSVKNFTDKIQYIKKLLHHKFKLFF